MSDRPARPTMPASTPSITKRINDKHNILNGLIQTDGSVAGDKLIQRLSETPIRRIERLLNEALKELQELKAESK